MNPHSNSNHPNSTSTSNPSSSNHLTHSISLSNPPPSLSKRPLKLPIDDDEILAKKKKNADAQAAFRLRRQTYIKSLEDTVTQLKNGVSEMQVLLNSATHDVKLQRERVAFLESKLNQSQSSNLSPSESLPNPSSPPPHCVCCRYAPSLELDQPPQHPSSSSSLVKPATTPTVPSPLSTPILTPQSLHHQRNWSSRPRPPYPPPVLIPHPPPPNNSPPPPSPAPPPSQSPYNRLLPRHPSTDQHESTPSSSYGAMLFDHFTTSSSANAPLYQSSIDIHHHHQHPSSSPPLESPRSATYLGIHQPASRAWPTYPPDHQPTPHQHLYHSQQPHSYKVDEPRYYTDDHLQPKRRRDDDGVAKLNGLPAKVARCNQAVMEVSKVVEQAKLATATGANPSKFDYSASPGIV